MKKLITISISTHFLRTAAVALMVTASFAASAALHAAEHIFNVGDTVSTNFDINALGTYPGDYHPAQSEYIFRVNYAAGAAPAVYSGNLSGVQGNALTVAGAGGTLQFRGNNSAYPGDLFLINSTVNIEANSNLPPDISRIFFEGSTNQSLNGAITAALNASSATPAFAEAVSAARASGDDAGNALPTLEFESDASIAISNQRFVVADGRAGSIALRRGASLSIGDRNSTNADSFESGGSLSVGTGSLFLITNESHGRLDFSTNTLEFSSTGGGGAISNAGFFATSASTRIDENFISGNVVFGGALAGRANSVTELYGDVNIFSSNRVTGASSALGGAVHVSNAVTRFSGVTYFENNQAYSASTLATGAARGGALYQDSPSSTIFSSTGIFIGNIAGRRGLNESLTASGGAIHNEGSLQFPYIWHSAFFQNNSANARSQSSVASSAQGGAIFNASTGDIYFGGPSHFIGNTAEVLATQAGNVYGGAIYNAGGSFSGLLGGVQTPGIIGAYFDGNVARNGAGGRAAGGAIYTTGGLTAVYNSVFTGNQALSTSSNTAGGAIYASGNALNVTNSAFINNLSQSTSNAEAGVASGLGLVDNSSFLGNRAQAQYSVFGGALVGVSEVRRSAFIANRVESSIDVRGGAIYAGTLDLQDSAFFKNEARSNSNATGSAVYTEMPTGYANIRNSIFVNNELHGNGIGIFGGAVYLSGMASSRATISADAGKVTLFSGNRNVANNGAPRPAGLYSLGTSVEINVGAGGAVDMRDPARLGSTTSTRKTGAGQWRLGGSTENTGSGGNGGFVIEGGRVHLYGAGEVHNNSLGQVETGKIVQSHASTDTTLFSLVGGTKLSVGGTGHVVQAKTLDLATGSSLGFDLYGHDASLTTPQLTFEVAAVNVPDSAITVDLLSLPATSGQRVLAAVTGPATGFGGSSKVLPAVTIRGEAASSSARAVALGLSAAISGASNNEIRLSNTAGYTSLSLIWNGADGAAWNIASGNWTGSGVSTYLPGDSVTFITNTGATPRNIAVNAGGVSVSNMTVTQGSYTFNGGEIVSRGAYTQNGLAGAVTFGGYTQFNGGVSVSAGRLNVRDTLITSQVSVSAGAILGGGGLIDATANINSAILAPGYTSPAAPFVPLSAATLTVTGGVTLTNNAKLLVTLEDRNNYSQIVSGGDFILNGANNRLEVVLNFEPTSTDVFTIVSALSVQGKFKLDTIAGKEDIVMAQYNGVSYPLAVSYFNNPGMILLTPVPEPGTYGLFAALGALALVALRRRCRQGTNTAAKATPN